MTLKNFLEKWQAEEKCSFRQSCRLFAKNVQSGWWTIHNVAHNKQKPSALLASRIVYATTGLVRFEDLRPDIEKNLIQRRNIC